MGRRSSGGHPVRRKFLVGRPYCDHDPRKRVTKDLPGDNPGEKDLSRLMAGLHEVDRDAAVTRPQHAVSDPDNPGEGRRIADRPNTFRAVAEVRTEVLASMKYPRQRLALVWRKDLVVHAFHVHGPI